MYHPELTCRNGETQNNSDALNETGCFILVFPVHNEVSIFELLTTSETEKA